MSIIKNQINKLVKEVLSNPYGADPTKLSDEELKQKLDMYTKASKNPSFNEHGIKLLLKYQDESKRRKLMKEEELIRGLKRLSPEEVEELYINFPKLDDPNYPKTVLKKYNDGSVLLSIIVGLSGNNVSYLVRSSPILGDSWYENDSQIEIKESKSCSCGCNSCGEGEGPKLNENFKGKLITTEAFDIHIKKNIPLTESKYPKNSKEYKNLLDEARYLYSREVIDLNKKDTELILKEYSNDDMSMAFRSMNDRISPKSYFLDKSRSPETVDTPRPKKHKQTASKSVKNSSKIKALQMKRDQVMRDMEQEAEPEGGPIADRYGRELTKIDKALALLKETKLKESSDKVHIGTNTKTDSDIFFEPSTGNFYLNVIDGVNRVNKLQANTIDDILAKFPNWKWTEEGKGLFPEVID